VGIGEGETPSPPAATTGSRASRSPEGWYL